MLWQTKEKPTHTKPCLRKVVLDKNYVQLIVLVIFSLSEKIVEEILSLPDLWMHRIQILNSAVKSFGHTVTSLYIGDEP